MTAILQAVGLGLAIGMIVGTTGLEGSARGGITLVAGFVGLAAGAIAASADDDSVLVGAVFGFLGAALACVIVSDVIAGARRRRGAGTGALGFIVAMFALAIAGATILFPPFVLIPLIGLIWLGLARRRRAQRKYEGLRVLR
jgi:cytochrome bd-type quinol oxidase subunit 2